MDAGDQAGHDLLLLGWVVGLGGHLSGLGGGSGRPRTRHAVRQ